MQFLPYKHEDLPQDSFNWTYVLSGLWLNPNDTAEGKVFIFSPWWFISTRGLSPSLFLQAVLEHEKMLFRQHLYSRTRHHPGVARPELQLSNKVLSSISTLTQNCIDFCVGHLNTSAGHRRRGQFIPFWCWKRMTGVSVPPSSTIWAFSGDRLTLFS